jgi:peptide/nickel transport system permease protein
VLLIAIVAYGGMRVLRPEDYGETGVITGLRGDLDRALLHFDFGEACMFRGCPKVRDLWARGYEADLWLLGGGLLFGVVGGVGAGVWCATRPRSSGARALEAAAMLAFCTPVYVVGLGVLLLFSPAFGVWHLPFFFDPHSYVSPRESPWGGLRSLLVPSLIVAAPLGAMCLRLTVALTRDALTENHIQTAFAKGVPHRRVIRHHAAPSAYASIASLLSVTIPAVVTNLVLVEWVFSVPGFFRHTKRALAQATPPTIDVPTLQALGLWAAALIVVMSAAADIALVKLDPRLRASGRPPG